MNKVFISYVRENIEIVDRLYQELKAHGIQVWLDRNDIAPGSRWKRETRRAIQQGAFFIACFSEEYNERNKTYMNEELTIAIEELRQYPTDRIWFIPVKLNDCEIPNRDIGSGETLQAFQHVNLYEDWNNNIQRILKVIQPASSEPVINVSTAQPWEIEVQPQDANAYFEQGNVYQSKGDYEHAIEAFNRAIELKPDYADAYYDRGVVYGKKSDYDRAIDDFNKAIDLNPDYADAYYNRGVLYYKQSDYDRAIEDFNKAIDLNPDYADAYYNRGVVYGEKSDYDRAIDDFNKAIDLNPDYANAYNNRGNAYSSKGDFDRAIRDFNKAIDLNPDYADVYYNRGNDYRNKGDYDRAIRDFNKAIALKPDFAIAYFNRGIVWLYLGKQKKARADLTAARNMGVKLPAEIAAVLF